MTYQLYIGDKLFSSWSLRGWLMLEKFGLPFDEVMVGLYDGTMANDLAQVYPARTVPALKTPEGHVLTDSLAMAETLVERHPDSGLYPTDADARALCRSMIAEMHSGFFALREACPMQLSHVWQGFAPATGFLNDLERIETLWALAKEKHGQNGPWLFGQYSLADVFYAPVAMRIAGYGLPVGAQSKAYVDCHLSDPAIIKWRAAGLEKTYDPWPYPQSLAKAPWPNGSVT